MTNQEAKALEYLTQANSKKFKLEVAHGYLVLFEYKRPIFWASITK